VERGFYGPDVLRATKPLVTKCWRKHTALTLTSSQASNFHHLQLESWRLYHKKSSHNFSSNPDDVALIAGHAICVNYKEYLCSSHPANGMFNRKRYQWDVKNSSSIIAAWPTSSGKTNYNIIQQHNSSNSHWRVQLGDHVSTETLNRAKWTGKQERKKAEMHRGKLATSYTHQIHLFVWAKSCEMGLLFSHKQYFQLNEINNFT